MFSVGRLLIHEILSSYFMGECELGSTGASGIHDCPDVDSVDGLRSRPDDSRFIATKTGDPN